MIKNFKKYIFLVNLLFLAITPMVYAEESLNVTINGPQTRKISYFIHPSYSLTSFPLPSYSSKLEKILTDNFNLIPFFNMVDLDKKLAPLNGGVLKKHINFSVLAAKKTDIAITLGWRGNALELRAYDVHEEKMLLGRSYQQIKSKDLGDIADKFSKELLKILTNFSGFFESKIAFEGRVGDGREIYVVSPQGRNLKQITNLGGINLSPEWSTNGDELAFTHLMEDGHLLGIVDLKTESSLFYPIPGNLVIAPTFMPDGRIAISTNVKGKINIFALTKDKKELTFLVNSWGIDVSPSFDDAGTKMSFTSSRLGKPHIFIKNLLTDEIKRVTYKGTYNTSPDLSPNGKYLAFSRSTPSGHRIFVTNLETDEEKQITFGPGSDEEPVFDSSGYFIVFSSNRAGKYSLYLTTREAITAKKIDTGNVEATAPAWQGTVFE